MGLDNGIEVKRTEYSVSIPWIAKHAFDWDKEKRYDFQICYWRKCWNIRTIILCTCNINSDNDCRYLLSVDDLINIRKELKKLNEKEWNSQGGSIWTWEEHAPINKKHIRELAKLIQLKRKHKDKLEIYFYDSY